MRRLKIDLADLEMAIDDASWEIESYLDLRTGHIAIVTEDARSELRATTRKCDRRMTAIAARSLRRCTKVISLNGISS